MKLLLDPIYTAKRMSKCATWAWFKHIGKLWTEQSDEHFVYCLVPFDDGYSRWVADDVVDDPRWINVPFPYTRDRYQNMLFAQDQLLDTVAYYGYAWDWDLMVTNRVHMIPAIKAQAWRQPRLVFAMEPFPQLPFKRTVGLPQREAVLQLCAGYASADRVYVKAPFEAEGMTAGMTKHMSLGEVRRFQSRLRVGFPRPDIDTQAPLKQGPRAISGGPLRLTYVQRLGVSQRNFPDVLRVLRTLASRGSGEYEIRISTNSEASGLPDDPFLFVAEGQLSREDFYAHLERQHVFITMSEEEGVPTGLMEAIVRGVMGVALRRPWSNDFFGRDYFLLCDTEAELVAAVEWIHDHRDEAVAKWREWYVGWLERYFDPLAVFDQRFLEDIAPLDDRVDEYGPHPVAEAIHEHAPDGPVSIAELLDSGDLPGVRWVTVPKSQIPHVPLFRRNQFQKVRMHLMYEYGWRDAGPEAGVMQRG